MSSENKDWVARLRGHIRGMGLAYLIFLVSLYPATLVVFRVEINVRNREEARLDSAVRDLREQVDRHVTDVTHVLWGVRGLFMASQTIRPAEWNGFLDSVGFSERSTGLRDLGFALRVASTNIQDHLKVQQRVGRADYELLPKGERAEYFPIIFMRDQDVGDVRSLGWDPYANEARRAAMDEARDTAEAVATATVPMALPGGDFTMEGHIIYLPVYRGTVEPATIAERREKLVGFVFASFREEPFWNAAFWQQNDPLLDVELFFGKDARHRRMVADIYPQFRWDLPRAENATVTETPLHCFGQQWTMRTTTLPKFAPGSESYFKYLAILAWGAISVMLFLMAFAQAKGRASAELLAAKLVQEKANEAELQREKERLAVTLRSIADGVIATDTAGKIVLLNNAAETITGLKQSEAIGLPVQEALSLIDEKTREKVVSSAEKILAGESLGEASQNVILVARDGRERIIAKSAAPIRDSQGQVVGAALVFRDITEKRRFEAELLKSSKLESVGLLAGGIAHDFNNILSIVLGNISLCKLMAPAGSLHERLAQAEKGCVRARELTQQLLTFAKGGAPIRKSVSILEIVQESTAFAARGSNLVCAHQAEPNLWPVEVDEGQISQVLNNLVINAVQAMPDGGKLNTRVENVVINDAMGLPLRAGRYVHVAIEDSGCGISSENIGRIFDPYFSTKKGGSGLGLATTYAIIQKHQGCITVESMVGRGTTFHIYLPASDSPAQRKTTDPTPSPKGAGRVLVMDDETAILDVARASLTHLGYEVDTAVHGGEAVEKFQTARAGGRPFSAVIMDLTVPGGMGGKEAMKRLLEIDPQVRAIVSSGYSQDPVMSQYREFGFAGVVEKPYQVEALAKALAAILEGNATN